MTACTCH